MITSLYPRGSSVANILVFDSGMGGLSVYREIRRLLPGHHYFYCFDNAHFPYGELAEEALITACANTVEQMVSEHAINLVVIACNTASTIALPELRARLEIPVVGVVPAIKPAVALTQNGCIGLLATPGTVSRDYTLRLIEQFAPGKQVLLKGSTELVVQAERKLAGEPVDMDVLRAVMASWREEGHSPDTVVLGCTHFPLLADELAEILPGVTFVDSGEAVAKRVRHLLGSGGSAGEERGLAYCTRLDAAALKLQAPLMSWGLEQLRQVGD